jgi:hypothetical protein
VVIKLFPSFLAIQSRALTAKARANRDLSYACSRAPTNSGNKDSVSCTNTINTHPATPESIDIQRSNNNVLCNFMLFGYVFTAQNTICMRSRTVVALSVVRDLAIL